MAAGANGQARVDVVREEWGHYYYYYSNINDSGMACNQRLILLPRRIFESSKVPFDMTKMDDTRTANRKMPGNSVGTRTGQ